ncbi:MAG: hypothetical protein AABZ08_10870 [Planctomycetota bacterium]
MIPRCFPYRCLGLILCVAVLLSGAGCGLLWRLIGQSPPGFPTFGDSLTPAGAVSLHVTNASGFPLVVEASYHIDDQDVRITKRFLPSEGVESETDVLATVTSVLKITAHVTEKDPTSQPATSQPTTQPTTQPDVKPGDLIFAVELHWKVDFQEGEQLFIVIPGPKPPAGDILDCNSNGISDAIDVVSGVSRDCNCNTIPDECDIVAGVLHDVSPVDGVPDECTSCPTVQLVVVMDTSGSMDDEASALCTFILSGVVEDLTGQGITVEATLLGISESPEGIFSCLTDDVAHLLGSLVPGAPPCCPTLNGNEDWAPAVAIVAERFAWSTGTVRIIIPISDEGPREGDPCDNPGDDLASIQNAVQVATTHHVIVSPITGTGSSGCVVDLAQTLAQGTSGRTFSSTAPGTDLAGAIRTLVLDACSLMNDCGTLP